jgi:hypothetical protein
LLQTQCADVLFASGDSAEGDPEAAAVLSRLVARHVESLLALVMDSAAASSAAATTATSAAAAGAAADVFAGERAGAAAAKIDGSTVVTVLRAAGAARNATAAAATLDAHKAMRPLLSLDVSAREEAAAFAVWKEKPPVGAAARAGAAAKARFIEAALSDRFVALPPAGSAEGAPK